MKKSDNKSKSETDSQGLWNTLSQEKKREQISLAVHKLRKAVELRNLYHDLNKL